ncbi:MAG: T9SS type A sorting domain-containing protein [Flavobacteriales bacterium]
MKNILITGLILVGVNSVSAQTVWTEIATPTDKDLNVIQFVSNEVGYVAGDSVLMKTEDGGATWSNMLLDSVPNNINQSNEILDMHWFTESHGMLMAGPWGGFYQTTDGGINWTAVGTANAGFCQTSALFFFDEDFGFAGGAGCFEGHIIDRFENGTWSTTNYPNDWDSNNWITALEFADATNGLAGAIDGTILRTDDGGLNWDTVPDVLLDTTVSDFIFYPDGTIRATHAEGNTGGVMISTDGGLTWQTDSETLTFFYPGMNAGHLDANGTTYIGGTSGFGDGGVIFDNSGEFWNWGSIDKPINDITSYGDSITFLVGDSGAIYSSANPMTLGVEDEETMNFNLAPNPVQDKIQITGLTESIVGYSIIDVSGRTVVEADKRAFGRFDVDVSILNNGCYFLNLKTDHGKGTKRFVKL